MDEIQCFSIGSVATAYSAIMGNVNRCYSDDASKRLMAFYLNKNGKNTIAYNIIIVTHMVRHVNLMES